MYRCGFRTLRGSFCRRRGKKELFRCYAHRDVAAAPNMGEEFLNICPVCLEDVHADDDSQLQCAHPIHLECAKQLWDPFCPLCRRAICAAEGKITQEHLEIIIARRKSATTRREAVEGLALARIIAAYAPQTEVLESLRELEARREEMDAAIEEHERRLYTLERRLEEWRREFL